MHPCHIIKTKNFDKIKKKNVYNLKLVFVHKNRHNYRVFLMEKVLKDNIIFTIWLFGVTIPVCLNDMKFYKANFNFYGKDCATRDENKQRSNIPQLRSWKKKSIKIHLNSFTNFELIIISFRSLNKVWSSNVSINFIYC